MAIHAEPQQTQVPTSCYHIPAYYLDTFLNGNDGREIARCIGYGSIDLNQYFQTLVDKKNQSIDVTLATIEKRPEWLLHFAKSKYANVRLRVAKNEHATVEVLRLLAQDSDLKIVQTTIKHRNFAGEALAEFSENTTSSIIERVDRLQTIKWTELCDFFVMPELPEEV
jgi:hypothetical protein